MRWLRVGSDVSVGRVVFKIHMTTVTYRWLVDGRVGMKRIIRREKVEAVLLESKRVIAAGGTGSGRRSEMTQKHQVGM